jgi:ferredoxin
MNFFRGLVGIAKGMSVTLREMFSPTVVENYPDGKGPYKGAVFQERFRGLHVLQRDENGLEKCVACFLCAAACPSNCIYIEAAENTAEHRYHPRPRLRIGYDECQQSRLSQRATAGTNARPSAQCTRPRSAAAACARDAAIVGSLWYSDPAMRYTLRMRSFPSRH